MLPDRSVLIGKKMVENIKIQKFKCDILGDFQTMCGYFFLFCLADGMAMGISEFFFVEPQIFFRKDETKQSSESSSCSVVTSKQNSSSSSHPKRVTQRKRRKSLRFFFSCVSSVGFFLNSRIFGLIWG